MQVDFTPKNKSVGILKAKYLDTENKINWEDGNVWTRPNLFNKDNEYNPGNDKIINNQDSLKMIKPN